MKGKLITLLLAAAALLLPGSAATAKPSPGELVLWKVQEGDPEHPRAVILVHGVAPALADESFQDNPKDTWTDLMRSVDPKHWPAPSQVFGGAPASLGKQPTANPWIAAGNLPPGWRSFRKPVWDPFREEVGQHPRELALHNPRFVDDECWDLRQYCAIYTFSYPNGFTDMQAAPEIAERMYREVLAKLPSDKKVRLLIVGHSHGGVVAREFGLLAARAGAAFPHVVQSLTYVGSPLDGKRSFSAVLIELALLLEDLHTPPDLPSLESVAGPGWHFLRRLSWNVHARSHGMNNSKKTGVATWRELYQPLQKARRAPWNGDGGTMRQFVFWGDWRTPQDLGQAAAEGTAALLARNEQAFSRNLDYIAHRIPEEGETLLAGVGGAGASLGIRAGDGVIAYTSALGLVNGPHPPESAQMGLTRSGHSSVACSHLEEEEVGSARCITGPNSAHTSLPKSQEFLLFLKEQVIGEDALSDIRNRKDVILDFYRTDLGRDPDVFGLHHYMWDPKYQNGNQWAPAPVQDGLLQSGERLEAVKAIYAGVPMSEVELQQIALQDTPLNVLRMDAERRRPQVQNMP